ncbi:hypothetical protein [Coleofasciculus sp. FACHB-T130]|uniref:hypothetical protein n=1 Tax=Cyanophyceae TaxID=3028117 RepID=UPI00168931D9|nr:hypothetical protein [Coleofasciculus sp. FACHB-T130]MBD1879082.1 hypothetical protein [Coleofasciculus sp. FACHB-T130]
MPDDTPIIRFRLRKRLLPLYRQIQEAKPGALCGEIFSDLLILYGNHYLNHLKPLGRIAEEITETAPLTATATPSIPTVPPPQPQSKQHDAATSLSKLRSKLQ